MKPKFLPKCSFLLGIALAVPVAAASSGPSIQGAWVDGRGRLGIGATLDVGVHYSEPVTVSTTGGTPSLMIGLSRSSAGKAVYLSGSGTTGLVFRYTVSKGDLSLDGVTIPGSLSLNGGSIRGASGLAASTTFASVHSSEVSIDGVAPTILGVQFFETSSSIGPVVGPSGMLTFVVTTSEPVVVKQQGGTPYLALTVGSTTKRARFFGTQTSGGIVFQYSVEAGDLDTDGVTVQSGLVLNGSTIVDSAGNPLDTAMSGVRAKAVDAVPPRVVGVVPPAKGTYRIGQKLDFTVVFDEPTTPIKVPSLDLLVGSMRRSATYVSGGGSPWLVFRYPVVAGDLDTQGVSISDSTKVHGGQVEDALRNTGPIGVPDTSWAGVLVDARPPTLAAVSPPMGAASGVTRVILQGTGFTGTTAVVIGRDTISFQVVSPTRIEATAPPQAAGSVSVVILHPNGTAIGTFRYVAAPVVTSVGSGGSPRGPAAGGNQATITGTDLTGASSVLFGSHPSTSFVVNSATSITATVPPGSPGRVHVVVTTPYGISATTSSDGYQYLPAPRIRSISPNFGPLAGGTIVRIAVSDLSDAQSVRFGTTPAAINQVAAEAIYATSPSGTSGFVDISVVCLGGTSTPVAADRFLYAGVPKVTGVVANLGSSLGGDTVAIFGTDLGNAASVTFDTSHAVILRNSPDSVVVVTPGHPVGVVDIAVATPMGTSATSATDRFTYAPVPVVASISPPDGPGSGGTSLTIRGRGLLGATSVAFGTGLASSISPISDSVLTAIAPPGAGPVPVVVTTPGGRSAVDLTFRYDPPSIVRVDHRSSGSVDGSKVGDILSFDVLFSEPVTIRTSGGRPHLDLTIGDSARRADCDSTGGLAMTCTYTVAVGDLDEDGVELGSRVVLDGATIRGTTGMDADLFLAGGNLPDLVVDGIPPRIVTVAVPSNGVNGIGARLDFSVEFSEPVSVAQAGRQASLPFSIGSRSRSAPCLAPPAGATGMDCSYAVDTGDFDTSGIAIGPALDLGGTRISDAVGNVLVPTWSGTTSPGVRIDGRLEQAIQFDSIGPFVYGGQGIPLQATSSSGLPVSFSSGAPAVLRISGDTVHLLGVDTVALTAWQEGSALYKPAVPVQRTVRILRRPLSIAGAEASDKIYDGTTAASVDGVSLSGAVGGDDVSLVPGRAMFLDPDVGTGKPVILTGSVLSGRDTAKYTFLRASSVGGLVPDSTQSVLRASILPRTVSVVARGVRKLAGSPDPVLSFSDTGLIGSDTLAGNLGRSPGEEPGTYPITQGTLSAGANYAISFVGADLTIAGGTTATEPRKAKVIRAGGIAAEIVHPIAAAATVLQGSGRLGTEACDDGNCLYMSIAIPSAAHVHVSIFDHLGTPVIAWDRDYDARELRSKVPSPDGRYPVDLAWNLRSADGRPVASGVYLWKVEISTADGQRLETVKKTGVR